MTSRERRITAKMARVARYVGEEITGIIFDILRGLGWMALTLVIAAGVFTIITWSIKQSW